VLTVLYMKVSITRGLVRFFDSVNGIVYFNSNIRDLVRFRCLPAFAWMKLWN